jgi:hypothetical protein
MAKPSQKKNRHEVTSRAKQRLPAPQPHRAMAKPNKGTMVKPNKMNKGEASERSKAN